MLKAAFSTEPLKAVLKHPSTRWGAGMAAVSGLSQAGTNKLIRSHGTKDQKERLKKHKVFYHPLTQAAIGGVQGAAFGHIFSGLGGSSYHARPRPRPGAEAGPARVKDTGVPDWLKGAKSKEEAKNAFKAQAMKHHPDRGGSEEKMKNVNSQWDSFKAHHFDKLSMLLPSLFNEMMEIRNATSR